MDKYNSRKLIVVSIGIVLGIILRLFNLLDKVTADFLIYMIGVYVVGNVGVDIGRNVIGKIRGPNL